MKRKVIYDYSSFMKRHPEEAMAMVCGELRMQERIDNLLDGLREGNAGATDRRESSEFSGGGLERRGG